MKLIIDIPDELYKEYVSINLARGNGRGITSNLLNAIKKGKPVVNLEFFTDKEE